MDNYKSYVLDNKSINLGLNPKIQYYLSKLKALSEEIQKLNDKK